jgi:hypothetical protein
MNYKKKKKLKKIEAEIDKMQDPKQENTEATSFTIQVIKK